MKEILTDLAVEQLAERIKHGTLSPVELTEAALARIEETDEKLNAYITVYREEALEAARQAEEDIKKGHYKGIFHGIPLALKDNIFFEGKRTTMASEIHKDFVPAYDAAVVENLREAGAVLIGKLNLHEYALSITSSSPHFGPVHNPWDITKIPGGSSGGSAAAIAAGSSFASVGTDTAGSIRIPSAACGTVGLKPTRGLVSAHGVYPLSWTQDHVGPMAKTVRDTAALLEILAGYEERDPVSAERPAETYLDKINGSVKGLRIGIEENYFFKDIDAPIEKAVRGVIEALVKAGAETKAMNIEALKDMDWAGFTFSVSEASAVHYDAILERPEDFGEDIRGFLQMGAFPSTKTYAAALEARQRIIDGFEQVFKEVDVLITPTIPVFPNNIGEVKADLNGEKVDLLPHFIRLTGPANITGLPALSVPCGLHNGLPVGVQIIGNNFAESTVLNTGYAIEQLNLMEGKHPEI